MEVYTAIFEGNLGEMTEQTNAKILDENSFQELRYKKVLFVGDGYVKAKEILQLPQAEFQGGVYPSAKYLVRKAYQKFLEKDFEDIAYFEPFYLKDFHGIKKK